MQYASWELGNDMEVVRAMRNIRLIAPRGHLHAHPLTLGHLTNWIYK